MWRWGAGRVAVDKAQPPDLTNLFVHFKQKPEEIKQQHTMNTARDHRHRSHITPSTPIQASSSTTAISEGSLLLLQRVQGEKEHEKCTNETKSSLLTEGLANVSQVYRNLCANSFLQLRILTKEIQEDDWKYNDTCGSNDYHGMK